MLAKYAMLLLLLLHACILHHAFRGPNGVDAAERSPLSPALSDADECILRVQRRMWPTSRRRTLDGLVGIGWDNLRNVETLPVFKSSFKNCQFTPDSLYLVPDGVTVLPKHQSELDSSARYYSNFTEFDRRVTKEHGVSGGASFFGFSISGSYSERHQEVKRSMNEQQGGMLHTRLTEHTYTLVAEETSPLADGFRARIVEIAVALMKGLAMTAKFLAETLIRDFGTHVVNRAEVGASIEKEDFFEDTEEMRSKEVLDSMRSVAGASFGAMFNVSVSFAREATESEMRQFKSSVKDTRIRTIGGPSVNRLISATKGEPLLVDDVVAFDVKGIPLANLVNPYNFPTYAYDLLESVQAHIERAFAAYCTHNTVRGCTTVTAPNFNFQANVDDGSCLPNTNTYEFGGVFQLCSPNTKLAPYTRESRCDDIRQLNLFTGGMSCSEGYKAVKLFSTTHHFPDRHELREWKHCDGFLWFTNCDYGYNDYIFKDVVDVDFYECRGAPVNASAMTAEGRGALFGGIYSDQSKVNPFTGANGCPDYFLPYRMGIDRFLCVSRDYEWATSVSVPFAHFFSCQSPNKTCPQGYSQHLAGVFEACEVYACVRTGVFRRFESRPIHLPPYTDLRHSLTNVSAPTIYGFYQGVRYLEISFQEALLRADELMMSAGKPSRSSASSASEIDYKLDVFMNHTRSEILKLARESPVVWETMKDFVRNGSTTAELVAYTRHALTTQEQGEGFGSILPYVLVGVVVLAVLLLGTLFWYLRRFLKQRAQDGGEHQRINE